MTETRISAWAWCVVLAPIIMWLAVLYGILR